VSIKKTSFWLILVNGLNFGINFIFSPFLARTLTLEEYGSYGQALMVSQFLILIFTIGIPSVYMILMAKYRNKVNILFSQVNYIFFTMATLSIPIQIMLAVYSRYWLGNDISSELNIFIFHTIGSILSSVLTLHLVFYNITKPLLYTTLITNIIKISLALLMIYHFKSYEGFVFTIALIPILNWLILYINIPKLDKVWIYPKIKIAKTIILESYPYFILGLLGYATLYVDGWLISRMLTVEDYAIYRNGAIEIPFLATIYSSISTAMLGKLTLLYKENKIDEIFELKKKASTIIAFVTFPIVIFLIVNSKILIVSYLSNKYLDSFLVFSIYNFSSLVRINSYQDLLIINRSNNILLKSNFVISILNIIIMTVAIKSFGIYGAAFSYSLSVLLLAITLTYYTLKIFNRKIVEYFDSFAIFTVICFSFIFSFISYFLIENILIYFFIFAFYLFVVYGLLFRNFKFFDLAILPNRLRFIKKIYKLND